MAIPVVLDTDIGSDIDDTWALAMLLRCPELDLKLVLTDTLNTVYRAKVAAKLLEVAGRTDVSVGIGLHGKTDVNEFQLPWVKDYDLQAYKGAVHEDGVHAMINLIRQSSEPITIIGISPAANLEYALSIAPDIAPKCKFVGMFGSIERGYGAGSRPIPETNVRENVSAARKVFSASWQDILVTPLDTCDQAVLRGEQYQRICNAKDPLIQSLIENYRIWAHLVDWMEVDFYEHRSSTLFDTVAVYLAYSQDFVNIEPMHWRITDEGMTLRDEDGYFVNAALSWHDLDAFHDHLVQRLLGTR